MEGLRRRADIVFTRARIAVFVDGCFWHGCRAHARLPRANGSWWRAKIGANRARDRHTTHRLKASGWSVIRVWEHEQASSAARRVIRAWMNEVRAD
jgi:DNA mismatch endonuclease (patch repair protein)